MYRTGRNGRPVQQSYTLLGSASISPQKGKHEGKGPEPTTRTPPHPPQPGRPGHGTRGTPPQATPQETEGGGHAKGVAGGHTTNRPQPGGAVNHTAETGEGPRHTAPTPTQSRQTKPEKARTGTQTHHQHSAHTPAHPHNTHQHNRRRHEPHKRTPDTKAQTPPAPQTHPTHENPKNKNPATPRQGSCRAARNTARTQRWTHQALSQDWRAATPSNTQPTTPKPRTRHYDAHTSTATNTQTRRHNTLTSGNTRNQRRHRPQHQRPQHPAKHLRHPHRQQTNTRSRPTLTNDRTRAPHRPAPRTTTTSIHTIGDTNTTNNQASTTPSPTPSPPAPLPTKPTHTNTGYSTYITQANGIKHTIANITPPSASPAATSATRGNQSHHNL